MSLVFGFVLPEICQLCFAWRYHHKENGILQKGSLRKECARYCQYAENL